MAFWEFLIQKEGDRSWLPLESPKVEVLEGRYRIVAHASQPDMPIEVRVTHTTITEIPPIRRTQKRFSRTNKNGLVVIMPFTRLLPGTWDLRCTSDLMAEMLGEGWQYTVRLQVLPLDVETGDEWEPDWQGEAAESLTALTQHQLEASESSTAVPLAEPSELSPAPEQPVSAVSASDLLPLAAHSLTAIPTSTDPTPTDPTPQTPDSQPSAIDADDAADANSDSIPQFAAVADAAVRLQLGQDTYVIQRGQPLILMGQVETADAQPSDRPFALEALQVRLYDPRTSQILIEEQQPLTARTLPFPFTCRITLPDHFQTYLVLGEIILYGTTSEGSSSILVMQPFSVTTDLHELLEAIANDFSEAELPLPPSTAESGRANYAPEPDALELLHTPVAPLQFVPSPQQPLPPQLRPANPEKTWQSLDLPSFHEAAEPAGELASDAGALGVDETGDLTPPSTEVAPDRAPEPLIDEVAIDEVNGIATTGEPLSIGEPLGIEEIEKTEAPEPTLLSTQQPTQQSPLPAPASPSLVPQAFDNDAPIPDWDRDESRSRRQPQPPPEQKPVSPEDAAFRSLNLQERFWTRLQALAADQELTEWLSTFDDGPWEGRSRSNRALDQRDAVLTAHEVVVEELPAAETEGFSEFSDTQAGVPVLPIQQPLPIPELEVKAGELTAGQPLKVQAKLPDLSYPLLVKLWLIDRQSRSVLDGPYWLTDFVPSGFGDLVAQSELTVPHGCVELQLEAIAIEMTTQRESGKATITRPVSPADVSNLALDELDV